MTRSRKRFRSVGILFSLISLFFPVSFNLALAGEHWTGRRIVEEALRRHELFPHVFEEQTIIMMDGMGNRDVRKLRRFSRMESDGTAKFLLVFDNPAEIKGVALLAIRTGTGRVENRIYIPASGKMVESATAESQTTHVLGTDFAVEDLTGEIPTDFAYTRKADQKIGEIGCFVVDARPKDREAEGTSVHGNRRHFVRKDTFFIIRTDYFDRRKRLAKSLTRYDLKKVDRNKWRADMILMDNRMEQHRTLIKINRRVFSRDYVPSRIFSTDWLLKNHHLKHSKGPVLAPAR